MQNAAAHPDLGDEEPLYVNAKQYNRILKRRQARARFEAAIKANKDKVALYILTISRNLICMNQDIDMLCVVLEVLVGGSSRQVK